RGSLLRKEHFMQGTQRASYRFSSSGLTPAKWPTVRVGRVFLGEAKDLNFYANGNDDWVYHREIWRRLPFGMTRDHITHHGCSSKRESLSLDAIVEQIAGR